MISLVWKIIYFLSKFNSILIQFFEQIHAGVQLVNNKVGEDEEGILSSIPNILFPPSYEVLNKIEFCTTD